jgi:hypothetical protein
MTATRNSDKGFAARVSRNFIRSGMRPGLNSALGLPGHLSEEGGRSPNAGENMRASGARDLDSGAFPLRSCLV